MKFKDFLLERVSAGVYQNIDKSLLVISNLINKNFEKIRGKFDSSSSCVAIQIIYSIASVTGLSTKTIVSSIRNKLNFSSRGTTLDNIFNAVENSVFSENGKDYKLKLSLEAIFLPLTPISVFNLNFSVTKSYPD